MNSPMPAEPAITWLERGSQIIKPADVDVMIGFGWYKVGPLHSSAWQIKAGDGALRVASPGHDPYRSYVTLSGGTPGVQCVVENTVTDGAPGQRDAQACVVTVPR